MEKEGKKLECFVWNIRVSEINSFRGKNKKKRKQVELSFLSCCHRCHHDADEKEMAVDQSIHDYDYVLVEGEWLFEANYYYRCHHQEQNKH